MKAYSNCVLWSHERTEPLINQLSQDVFDESIALLPVDGSITATVNGKKSRIVRKTQGGYSAISVASDPDRVKSKKLMASEVDVVLAAAETIDAAVQRAEGRTRRLLHNLKSLTAKTSQEIFLIAQQDKLLGNPRDTLPYVASEIRQDIDGTARALVEILKHQAAQKAEFTAFDRLSGKLESKAFEIHEMHRVLMNVFYLFFGELVGKKVRAEVQPTRLQARFDYDSIHVCIYYLVENASKYVRPGSNFTVTTTADGNGLTIIRFEMESLVIRPEESDRIFEEGYSGISAIDAKLRGAGLGLYLARVMAQLNKGRLTVIAGRPLGRAQYARNIFTLTLPAN